MNNLGSNVLRFLTTALVWTFVMIIMNNTALFNPDSSVALGALFAVAAAVSTGAIWLAPALALRRDDNPAVERDVYPIKAKHDSRDRLARLVESMSDDQLDALGEALDEVETRRGR